MSEEWKTADELENSRIEARIAALEEALAPLVAIADAYDANGLDEARPEWNKICDSNSRKVADTELYNGRGGKNLLTLAHCFKAREITRKAKS